jgi:hypothetical protein
MAPSIGTTEPIPTTPTRRLVELALAAAPLLALGCAAAPAPSPAAAPPEPVSIVGVFRRGDSILNDRRGMWVLVEDRNGTRVGDSFLKLDGTFRVGPLPKDNYYVVLMDPDGYVLSDEVFWSPQNKSLVLGVGNPSTPQMNCLPPTNGR